MELMQKEDGDGSEEDGSEDGGDDVPTLKRKARVDCEAKSCNLHNHALASFV